MYNSIMYGFIKPPARRVFAILSVLTAYLAGMPSAAAIGLSVEPNFQQALQGDVVAVDVLVGGLHDEDPDEIVSAFDLALGYDPTILTPTGVTFGGWLDDPDSAANGGSYDPVSFVDLAFDLSTVSYGGPFTAAVEFAQVAFLPPTADPVNFPGAQGLDVLQPSSFVLATIIFEAIDLGVSALGILEDSNPDVGSPGLDLKGNDAETPLLLASVEDGSVAVVAVSEPQGLALSWFAICAGVLAWRRRGRSS